MTEIAETAAPKGAARRLTTVRVTSVGTAHPEGRLDQSDAGPIVSSFGVERRMAMMLSRHSAIDTRAIFMQPAELAVLGSAAVRNDIYRKEIPGLAREAVEQALDGHPADRIGCLVTSSCTGYSVPGWGVDLVEEFGFPPTTVRVPIMESACAGGAVALARAVDYLRSRPGETGLAVAAELCSLTFHAVFDEGTLLSVFLFGDAAGAVLLETGPGDGLEVVDSLTMLVAGSKEALGFDLTNLGLHPVLSRKLADVMTPYVEVAVSQLLSRNGLETSDVDAWLLHPGGPRILRAIEERFSLPEGTTRWSWDSLREFGNTSSAAVFDVLSRYFEEEPPDHSWAVLASFGPGVSIELVLLRRS